MPELPRKKGSRLASAIAGLTGFPPESLIDLPVLLCRGSMEILVEGCRSILEYSETRIRLDMGWQCVSVEGEALTMADFHRSCLTIRGRITGIRWEV